MIFPDVIYTTEEIKTKIDSNEILPQKLESFLKLLVLCNESQVKEGKVCITYLKLFTLMTITS